MTRKDSKISVITTLYQDRNSMNNPIFYEPTLLYRHIIYISSYNLYIKSYNLHNSYNFIISSYNLTDIAGYCAVYCGMLFTSFSVWRRDIKSGDTSLSVSVIYSRLFFSIIETNQIERSLSELLPHFSTAIRVTGWVH